MTSSLETPLKDKCMRWAKAQPNLWIVKILGGGIQEGGIPDILACYKGRFIAIELKRPDGEGALAIRQDAQLRRIKKAGGTAVVIDNLEDFKRIFK